MTGGLLLIILLIEKKCFHGSIDEMIAMLCDCDGDEDVSENFAKLFHP